MFIAWLLSSGAHFTHPFLYFVIVPVTVYIQLYLYILLVRHFTHALLQRMLKV